MDKKTLLSLLVIANAFFLVTSILLQARGEGLSSAFGGGGEHFRTRRGIEKFLFIATLILAFTFVILTLISLVVT